MKLYNWQRKCLREWEAHQYRGIVNAVTGAGKTKLALACIDLLRNRHPDLRVRIIVPTIALANQWRQIILRDDVSGGCLPGFFGNGMRNEGDGFVTIYVVNSARDSLTDHIRKDFAFDRHTLLICDECHRYMSKENYRMFSFITDDLSSLPHYHCLGLSATPFNGEWDASMRAVLGEKIFQYDFSEAASDGIIAPHVICQVSVPFLAKERIAYIEICNRISKNTRIVLKTYPWLKHLSPGKFLTELRKLAKAADMDSSDPAAALLLLIYQRKNIVIGSKARIHCCMELLKRLRSDAKILIFCERIEQAEELRQPILREYGNVCGIYHSQLSRQAKNRNLDEFRQGHIRILVSCRALDEGLDVPDASVGIVLSSSAVKRQRIQRLGRIVRSDPEKEQACLYYLYIQESTEDAAYLPTEDYSNVFDLKYYTAENDFSNDLYLFSALQLFDAATSRSLGKDHLKELRKCITEGICRPDYLLSDHIKDDRILKSDSTHERNYWRVMRCIKKNYYRDSDE